MFKLLLALILTLNILSPNTIVLANDLDFYRKHPNIDIYQWVELVEKHPHVLTIAKDLYNCSSIDLSDGYIGNHSINYWYCLKEEQQRISINNDKIMRKQIANLTYQINHEANFGTPVYGGYAESPILNTYIAGMQMYNAWQQNNPFGFPQNNPFGAYK